MMKNKTPKTEQPNSKQKDRNRLWRKTHQNRIDVKQLSTSFIIIDGGNGCKKKSGRRIWKAKSSCKVKQRRPRKEKRNNNKNCTNLKTHRLPNLNVLNRDRKHDEKQSQTKMKN